MAEIPGVTPLPIYDRGGVKYALLMLPDPGVVPPTVDGYAVLYVDPTSGDLKCKFADGFIATICADS
jgi:hypothetical protein